MNITIYPDFQGDFEPIVLSNREHIPRIGDKISCAKVGMYSATVRDVIWNDLLTEVDIFVHDYVV
jgi:hypothetical protein